MTIAAAYLTSEGIVLGADSATVISINQPKGIGGNVVQILRHTQKVFEIGEKSRYGICTWGSGSVANISHRAIIARVGDTITNTTTIENVIDSLIEEINNIKNSKPNVGDIGYYIGGWEISSHIPRCFQLVIQTNGEIKRQELTLGQGSFSGAPKFFSRVFRGFDPDLVQNLIRSIKQKISDAPENIDELIKSAIDEASAPLIAAGFQDLPIREAIDWVHFYLHLTVKAFKLQFVVPICCGPIEVAFITAYRCFRWVCHKEFDSAIKEEEV